MPRKSVLIIGTGHLAYRIRKLARDRGYEMVQVASDALRSPTSDTSVFNAIAHGIQGIDLRALAMTFLVDDHDERNFELLIAFVSIDNTLPIVASFFNENIAPHLQAAHPNVRILNPAKLAAPTFVAAMDTPVTHTLRYVPAPIDTQRLAPRSDNLIPRLMAAFGTLVAVAVAYFRVRLQLSWLDALYFVVVTVATVGYGDITLLNASPVTKAAGIALILASTVFIWMIFSLTVDNIIKRRVQLALGRKRYTCRDHVILCGLGRLGSFIAEGLLVRGKHVLVVERNEDAPAVAHLRALGADVYIGDARLPRVLNDVGVTRAKALYSVTNDDYANLEIGLNARSFAPDLRLVLRMFDESMSGRIKEHLDIHLTFSMTAIADELFFDALPSLAEGA